MRFVAALLTLIGLTAAAIAGQGLWQEVKDPPAAVIPATVAAEGDPQPPAAALSPRVWPALFGEPMPPMPPQSEPQPPAPVMAAPPKPQMPPLESLGYELKGLVRTEGAIWALVSHPAGERVLRPGEELELGYRIDRIDSAGIWVTDGAAEPTLLGFRE
ncbi:hypothetical protein [Marimonas arenosa]|uniref:Type II secretion system protein GspC N-terminal domain-containing protein n=1 Tax=Marimonas arenosa TaxID=1795305 RepID=A0AAE3WIR0_9RHOB|nr:hypothetical protein [Marimonas arenosa]MDQ2092218.1 hypothetical protein [Marimonas arenosa]